MLMIYSGTAIKPITATEITNENAHLDSTINNIPAHNFTSACSATGSSKAQDSNPLDNMGKVEIVASGFIATEGPVWHQTSNSILFSDIPGNTIYAVNSKTHSLSKIRTPSNTANGLALNVDGKLLAAEQASRTITQMDLLSNKVSAFISTFDYKGKPRAFNSPNDIAVHANGNVYFTDPPFGLQGRESELGFNGVFVRTPDGKIKLLKQFEMRQKPNGIIFNPDQSILYLAVSHDESAPILAFDVDSDGNLSNQREFVKGQNNDGMAIDKQGNLYVANRTGLRVWSKTGQYWGLIKLPQNIRTTNCAFGDEKMDTLYITNRSPNLYAVKFNTVGHQ